ncbi:MAG: TonB-dependent receptor [Bacteroidota bacterium]
MLRAAVIWSVLLGGMLLVWSGMAPEVHAQRIVVSTEAEPLDVGLRRFRAETGVDLVFAQRLVRGKRSSCRYEGTSFEEALACLLRGTGLKAEAVRRGQYVIVTDTVAEPVLPSQRRGILTGFVTDAETGEALPSAHVALPAWQIGTITNEAGYFALPSMPEGLHYVRFSYLGYEVQDTLLAINQRARIALQPKAFVAGDVTIEDERRNRASLQVVPGLLNMPVQQVEALPSFGGEADLFHTLEWMPGINKLGSVNGGMVIRGGTPDQNLYLIDGAPVYHPWHAFSLISTFQTETFQEVKLWRGAFPAEHGGRLSSVMEAQLRDGNRDAPQAQAALSLLSARFVIESPITPNASFMLSGRRSYLDKLIGQQHPVANAAGQRDTLRTGYYFYDWNAKLSLDVTPRSKLSFSFYRGRDVLDLRLPFDLSLDFSSWLRPADLFFEVDQDWGNRLYAMRYQYLFSSRFFVSVNVYNSAYDATEGSVIRPTSSALLASQYRVRLRDIGVRIAADYVHSQQHQLHFGIQAVQHRFRSSLDGRIQRSATAQDTLTNTNRVEAMDFAAYVEDTWRPTARLRIQPGLRVSSFSEGQYFYVTPRLFAQYTFDPVYFILRGGFSRQVQYLQHLRDRYSFAYDLVSIRWIPASDEVRPGRSRQASIGAESRPLPNLTVTADAYWRDLRDILLPEDPFRVKDGLIGPGIDVGTLLGQYTPGVGRSYGIEFSARYARGPWQLWASYAGGRTLDRAPELGDDALRPARFDVPREVRTVLARVGRRWDISLAGTVRSGYPHTVPEARYAVQGPFDAEPVRYLHRPDINNGRLPAYMRFDVSVGYRFGWGGVAWEAELQLYNLLNRRNVFDRFYDPDQATLQGEDRLGLPFLPLLELQASI